MGTPDLEQGQGGSVLTVSYTAHPVTEESEDSSSQTGQAGFFLLQSSIQTSASCEGCHNSDHVL